MFKNLVPEIILSIGVLHIIIRDFLSRRTAPCFHFYVIFAVFSILIGRIYEHKDYSFSADVIFQCFILLTYIFYYLFLLKKNRRKFSALSSLALIGCLHMISASNFLDFFLGAELAVLPTYIIAHIENESKKNFTYFCYGIIASAICVFGISLIYSATGTFDFFYVNLLISKENSDILKVGSCFLFLALCIKLGLFPFQKWFTNIFDLKIFSSISIINIIYKTSLAYVSLKIFTEVLQIESISFLSEFFVSTSIIIFTILAARQTDIVKIIQYIILEHSATIIAGWHGCDNHAFFGTISFIISECIALCCLLFIANNGNEFLEKITSNTNKLLLSFVCIAFASFPPFLGFYGKFHILISTLNTGNYILFSAIILSVFFSSIYIAKCIKIIWKNAMRTKYAVLQQSHITFIMYSVIALLSILPLILIVSLEF